MRIGKIASKRKFQILSQNRKLRLYKQIYKQITDLLTFTFTMAAAGTTMITALMALGLSQDAADYLSVAQAISDLSALKEMDDTEIKTLCKTCCKYGVSSANAANNRRNAPAPGIPIAMMHESNLKLASFFLKFKDMTSRVVDFPDLTVANVKALKDFKTHIESRVDPSLELAPKLADGKHLFDFFDNFREFLNEFIGPVSKRPLGYIVRKDWVVPASADDPSFGQAGSKYRDFYHEIETRAPIKTVGPPPQNAEIFDPHFRLDNNQVWKILHHVVKDTRFKDYIKKHTQKMDGRGAFETLHSQLLGRQSINNYAATAENTLQNLTLDGTKSKRWNFDTYVAAHMREHATIEKLKEHGYKGIDEASKVRHFVQGISDPALEVCRAAVATFENYDFDKVVTAYRTHIQSSKTLHRGRGPTLNVSMISRQSGNRTRDNRARRPTPDSDGYDFNKDYSQYPAKEMYYKADAWSKLTKGQRNYLRQKRDQKKLQQKKRGRGDSDKSKKSSTSSIDRRIAKLESQLQALSDTASVSSTESEGSIPSDTKSKSTKPSKGKIVRRK